MKTKISVFFYSLAAIYGSTGFIALFTSIAIPPAFSAYVSSVAFLIAAYDLVSVSFDIAVRNNIGVKIAYLAQLFFLAVAVTGSVFFVYYFMVVADQNVISKISNYATFCAIGIVFLTYGMRVRNS
jgi:hypothetical protein